MQGTGVAEACDLAAFHDLFVLVPRVAISSAGSQYIRWVPSGMPKLGKYQSLFKTVFFLYASREDAESGVKSGATGFIAVVPLDNWPNYYHWVGVTNWHAAVRDGLSVVRVNREDGGFDIFEHGPEEWIFMPGGPDVAVIPLSLVRGVHAARGIGPTMLLTKEGNKSAKIDAGDDVFMAGRFIDYDGVEVNRPSLRFGHISIMEAHVKQPTGYMGPSVVLDMHSRTGFSGSPVFVYRTSGAHFGEIPDGEESRAEIWIGHTIFFLGLHWGQFPEAWEMSKGKTAKKEAEKESLVVEGKYVKGMSGMTCVIPCDEILRVMNMPELKKRLRAEEIALEPKLRAEAARAPVAETAEDDKANPNHREDFSRLLTEAVRKREQED